MSGGLFLKIEKWNIPFKQEKIPHFRRKAAFLQRKHDRKSINFL